MPIQYPSQNVKPVNAILNENIDAGQRQEHNALVNDAATLSNKANQTQWDDSRKLRTARVFKKISTDGMQFMEKDPTSYAQWMPEMVAALQELELPVDKVPPAGSSPESVMEGLRNMNQIADTILSQQGPGPDPTYGQPVAGVGDDGQNRLYRPGPNGGMLDTGLRPPAGGGTDAPSNVREFREFEKLGDPSSPDILTPGQKRYLQVKRASGQVIDIGGVPNLVDKETGEQTPLSTIQAETSGAADMATASETAKQNAQIAALPKKNQAQAKSELPAIEDTVKQGTDLIDSILDDPGLPAVIGFMQGRTRGLTGRQRGLVKKIEQVQGKVFLDAFERLKGGGQITEIEGKAATDAQARINDRTVDEASFIDAMFELRETMELGLTRARESAGSGDSDEDRLKALGY